MNRLQFLFYCNVVQESIDERASDVTQEICNPTNSSTADDISVASSTADDISLVSQPSIVQVTLCSLLTCVSFEWLCNKTSDKTC